jgi:hypothetical protein
MTEVTYERPVTATLVVRLDNGEEFDAKPEDAGRFGYIGKEALLADFQRFITDAIGKHPKESEFAQLWNVLVVAVHNPEVLGHPEPMEPIKAELAHLDSWIKASRLAQTEF